jgi:phosphoglycolate phosphatase
MSKVVLFDIDGTLVLTGGAGMRALNRACEQVVGIPDVVADVPLAGRTDLIILQEAIQKLGRELDGPVLSDIKTRYAAALAEEIHLPGRGVKGIMPGVRGLLDALETRPDVFLALLTGNFAEAARIKLEYFDLWRYFRCGAFGDDAADRDALGPVALNRVRECGLDGVSPGAVLVVGDTPGDIACARAVGARSVGVATGNYSVEELRAAGGEHVFRDLRDTQAFLALL